MSRLGLPLMDYYVKSRLPLILRNVSHPMAAETWTEYLLNPIYGLATCFGMHSSCALAMHGCSSTSHLPFTSLSQIVLSTRRLQITVLQTIY